MLKAKKVSRAVIIGNKKQLDSTVEILHDFNCIHIEDFTEQDAFLSIGKPSKIASETSQKLIKLRSLSNFLGIKPKYLDTIQNESSVISELDSKLDELDSKVSNLLEKRNVLDAELKDIETLINELQPISEFPLDLEMYHGYQTISVSTGYVFGTSSEIEAGIKNITPDYELFVSTHNKSQVIALFTPVKHEIQVAELLDRYNFSEIHVPVITGDPKKQIMGRENRKKDILTELSGIDEDIAKLQSQHLDFVLAADEILSITTQKAEAPLRFATSDNTFLIDCWIADEQFDTVSKTIEDELKGSVYLSKLDMEEEEIKSSTVPVEYDNPGIVRPLQTIMDLYSRPSYKEIDPSLIIFITFPLFYGLMLGDIGYGLVLLTLGLIGRAKLRSEGLKPLATLLIYCSITTLIFGVLFAEIFGFHLFGHHSVVTELLGEHSALGGMFYNFGALPILERLGREDIPILLIATALIGVVHMNLGFLIGFRNEVVSHGVKVAVLEKISWMVLQLGIAIYAIAAIGYIPPFGETVGAVVAVLGLVMLIAGEGGTAILELPSILSNTLSYTRLAAVGLSSVGIAFAVNNIADMLFKEEGILFILGGIIVLLVGHTVNTILGVIAPGLHALRLQYVEFFTKFYNGGGRKFKTFGYDRKYTEE